MTNMTGYPSIDKPWLKYYTEKEIATELPVKTIYNHITEKNSDNLSSICLNYYGTEMSYGDFFSYVDTIASALENSGVKEKDIVTIAMLNSPETIGLFFALNKIGATANMVYGVSTATELKKYMIDAESHIVFCLDVFQEKFMEIAEDVQLELAIVSDVTQSMSAFNKFGARFIKGIKPVKLIKDSRFISWKDFLKRDNGSSFTVSDADAIAVINYTGGTTGGSKGVALSNKAVLAVCEQYIIGEEELYRKSKWIQVLPLFIAYGVTCSLLIPMSVGMTLIVRLPMADSIADLCKTFHPNHIIYGPAFWEAFADDNENLDLSNFIAPITGGDVLKPATEKKINRYLEQQGSKYKLMNGYGMTEVGAAVSVNYRDKYESGSVGLPYVKNIVAAFDTETGSELKCGERGELCIHTPTMMDGYINNEEETKNIIRTHEDGLKWVHTGDLGYISENGFIHIIGRLKRYMLCISGGIQKKVFSLDVERVLANAEDVENCVVVPIDDEEKNQVPAAWIIPKKGIETSIVEERLQQYCKANMEEWYLPRKYFFTDSFPLTKVGKIDYMKLEEMAKQ